MSEEKWNWRVPDPKSWRKGGFKNLSSTRHGNVRLIYHNSFKGAEGSIQCIDCHHVYRQEVTQNSRCPKCGKLDVSGTRQRCVRSDTPLDM